MPYRLPHLQNQHAFHRMIPPINQGNALRGGIRPDVAPSMAPRSYTMPPASYLSSAYPAVPGVQYPMAYPGGLIGQRPISGSPGNRPPAVVNSNSTTSPGVSSNSNSGSQLEGLFSVSFASCCHVWFFEGLN